MTPAGWARLGLRGLCLYFLLGLIEALPPAVTFLVVQIESAVPELSETVLGSAHMVFLAAATLTLWFRTPRIAQKLLPAGAGQELGADYPRCLRAAQLFMGGLVLVSSLTGLASLAGELGPVIPIPVTVFKLIIAIILIVGSDALPGILKRLFTTNWFSLLMRQRSRL